MRRPVTSRYVTSRYIEVWRCRASFLFENYLLMLQRHCDANGIKIHKRGDPQGERTCCAGGGFIHINTDDDCSHSHRRHSEATARTVSILCLLSAVQSIFSSITLTQRSDTLFLYHSTCKPTLICRIGGVGIKSTGSHSREPPQHPQWDAEQLCRKTLASIIDWGIYLKSSKAIASTGKLEKAPGKAQRILHSSELQR